MLKKAKHKNTKLWFKNKWKVKSQIMKVIIMNKENMQYNILVNNT